MDSRVTTQTAALPRSSGLRQYVRRYVPQGVIDYLRYRTPISYAAGRRINRRYLRYYEEARRGWSPALDHATPLARRIATEVAERGVALTRIADVSARPWDQLMTALERQLDDPRNGVCLRDGEYYVVASTEALLARPPQYLYLSDDVLQRESELPAYVTAPEVVAPLEAMLGCHVRLVNLMVYRNFAGGGKDAGSMKWHYDNQPVHCYKLIAYLSDVPEGSGEFQYLLGSSRDIHPVPGFGESRLSDPLAVQRYPVLRCTGGKGDGLYFNANGYHRGGNVARGRRTVLCAHYKPSKIPAAEHLARFGFGGVATPEYGPVPGKVWW